MATDSKPVRLPRRTTWAAVIVVLIQPGPVATNGQGALPGDFPVPHLTRNANSLDSADQGTQTRPRRVHPSDPAGQSPPDPAGEATASSKRQTDPGSDRTNPKPHSPGNRENAIAPSYTVQVGAFLQPENARRLAQSLGKNGYSAQVVTRSNSHGKKWHCVRVGSYADQEQARKTATEIDGKLKLKAIVRPSTSL